MLLKNWYTVSMDTLNFPTKRNLLLARQRLALARKGYDLLDKKRQVLAKELAAIQVQAQQIQQGLHKALGRAQDALDIAFMDMGRERVERVCHSTPKSATVEILFRSIMGVEVPLVNSKNATDLIYYKLSDTTMSLDETILAWREARAIIIAWSAIENTIHQLNLHIKKTQKRANALGNITIPKYEARIKYIQEQLEERERDELARLKLIKSAKSDF